MIAEHANISTLMAQMRKTPLIILGGRDHHSTTLPEGGRHKRLLRGYKAMDLIIGGRPLIELLVERMQASGSFEPIYIAGPKSVYGKARTVAQILETDGTFGENLRNCVDQMKAKHPGQQVMFTTCDILPDPDELLEALDDFHTHQPCDFWMPQCRIPADFQALGESSWKPKYHIQPQGEDAPAPVLPGHFIAVDPQIARVELLYRFFHSFYRTRNRPIASRYFIVARHVLLRLFYEDLCQLLKLRLPNITWGVVFNSLATAKLLQTDKATQTELEDRLRKIYINNKHRKHFPERRGRIAILHGFSLAKDIDTEEEAIEITLASEQSELEKST